MSKEGPKLAPIQPDWRSFWALIGMQGTNAFNDNFTKFILIPLGVGLSALGLAPSGMEYVLGLLMVLPFIIFAPTAGWLGDRFPKHKVIRWSSWLQLLVLSLMAGALWVGMSYGAESAGFALFVVVVAFFFLASQSALLSPAKLGIVKELVGAPRLGFANGIMEGSVILMILLGQIIGGVWFDQWGLQAGLGIWESALIPVLWILIGAVVALGFSHAIRPTKPAGAGPFSWKVATRHFSDLAQVRQNGPLWESTLGIAFFWGFGGFLQLLLIQVAQERTGSLAGLGVETAMLWVPVVVGIVIGSLFASWICRKRNELGLVAIGGFGMTLSMGLLTFFAGGWVNYGLLALAGAGGALFLVPLAAFQQDRTESSQLGLVLSASNLCNNLAGVFAVLLQFTLNFAGVPPWLQFLLVAGICGCVTVAMVRFRPHDFIRFFVLRIFRSFYRVHTLGVENIPKSGGVLMVANHLSYIDSLVLSAACPRPIRFVMFADCFERQWLGKVAHFFKTVAISPSRARDGIQLTAQALQEGSVVCVFAEGQISRTGALSEIKRGYQIMARKGGVKVLPAYLDGLWGSMWTFSGGNFLKKWPRTLRYEISVGFGPVISDREDVEEAMRQVSAETLQDREIRFAKSKRQEPELLGDLPMGWSERLSQAWADDEEGRAMRVNALQLQQVYLLDVGSRVLIEWVADDRLSGVLGILWPLSLRAKVGFFERESDHAVLERARKFGISAVVLRGVKGRAELVAALNEAGITVWTFDEEGRSNGSSFACLVRDGRVVAFARPHPEYPSTTGLPQSGWKPETRGKLLPGLTAKETGQLDAEGFLL